MFYLYLNFSPEV